MKENPSWRDRKPDVNIIQGIHCRYLGKETAAGLRQQRWSSKPQWSFTSPMETKKINSSQKLHWKWSQNVSATNDQCLWAPVECRRPPSRAASIPDSSKKWKEATDLVATMKWCRYVTDYQQMSLHFRRSLRRFVEEENRCYDSLAAYKLQRDIHQAGYEKTPLITNDEPQ